MVDSNDTSDCYLALHLVKGCWNFIIETTTQDRLHGTGVPVSICILPKKPGASGGPRHIRLVLVITIAPFRNTKKRFVVLPQKLRLHRRKLHLANLLAHPAKALLRKTVEQKQGTRCLEQNH
jgi:hypothetical protein